MNTLTNSEKAKVTEHAHTLSMIAAQLSGIQPILRKITDSASTTGEDGNVLEAVGALSEYINDKLCSISDDLIEIALTDERRAEREAIRQQLRGV